MGWAALRPSRPHTLLDRKKKGQSVWGRLGLRLGG